MRIAPMVGALAVAAVKIAGRLPMDGERAAASAALSARPFPLLDDARQPPVQGDRRGPGRRRVPAVVARPPALRRSAVAGPARRRLDAGVRGARAELRAARADGGERAGPPPGR